jgi:hypothetical protein
LDPSFTWQDDLSRASFYSLLQGLTVVLFILYASYFALVAYSSLF